MQHIHLTNSEIAAIDRFNAAPNDYRVDYAPRKRRFVLTDRTSGRLIDSGPELWDVIDAGVERELYLIERLNPLARIA